MPLKRVTLYQATCGLCGQYLNLAVPSKMSAELLLKHDDDWTFDELHGCVHVDCLQDALDEEEHRALRARMG